MLTTPRAVPASSPVEALIPMCPVRLRFGVSFKPGIPPLSGTCMLTPSFPLDPRFDTVNTPSFILITPAPRPERSKPPKRASPRLKGALQRPLPEMGAQGVPARPSTWISKVDSMVAFAVIVLSGAAPYTKVAWPGHGGNPKPAPAWTRMREKFGSVVISPPSTRSSVVKLCTAPATRGPECVITCAGNDTTRGARLVPCGHCSVICSVPVPV